MRLTGMSWILLIASLLAVTCQLEQAGTILHARPHDPGCVREPRAAAAYALRSGGAGTQPDVHLPVRRLEPEIRRAGGPQPGARRAAHPMEAGHPARGHRGDEPSGVRVEHHRGP